MIKSDTETKILCSYCGEYGIFREIFITRNNLAHKVGYETHHESIVDPEHIDALHRAENFYSGVFDLIDEFNKLPEATKIIRVTDPPAAGLFTGFDIGSERPSACQVRTKITPQFELRTFGKNFEIQLEPRGLRGTTVASLLEEATSRAQPIIQEARDRNNLGLG